MNQDYWGIDDILVESQVRRPISYAANSLRIQYRRAWSRLSRRLGGGGCAWPFLSHRSTSTRVSNCHTGWLRCLLYMTLLQFSSPSHMEPAYDQHSMPVLPLYGFVTWCPIGTRWPCAYPSCAYRFSDVQAGFRGNEAMARQGKWLRTYCRPTWGDFLAFTSSACCSAALQPTATLSPRVTCKRPGVLPWRCKSFCKDWMKMKRHVRFYLFTKSAKRMSVRRTNHAGVLGLIS